LSIFKGYMYGKLLANSKLDTIPQILIGKGSNIECPITKPKIDGFIYKLKKSSNLSTADLNQIQLKFQEGK